MIVAGIGIVVNGFTAFLFMGGQHDLNIRGAFLHMVADAAVSLGVVLGGLAILWTGATWIDPFSASSSPPSSSGAPGDLLRQSLTLSLHGVPQRHRRARGQSKPWSGCRASPASITCMSGP